MNKKICLFVCLLTALAEGKNYVGITTGLNILKTNGKISGQDNDGALFPFELNANRDANIFHGGVIIGKLFSIRKNWFSFIEGDALYANKSLSVENLNTESSSHPSALLNDENVIVTKGGEFGFTVGGGWQLNESLNLGFGIRLNTTQYKINIKSSDHLNDKTVWVTGLEPTIQLGYNLSDKAAIKVMFGYNFSKNTNVFDNYADPDLVATDDISASYAFKPSGYVIKTALIINF
jgi:hypothetical protein